MRSIVFFLFMFSAPCFACPPTLDDQGEKNVLIGFGASGLGIDLTQVSAISVENFAKVFSGIVGAGGCARKISTQANVTLKYARDDGFKCNSEIAVTRVQSVSASGKKSSETLTYGTPVQDCFPSI